MGTSLIVRGKGKWMTVWIVMKTSLQVMMTQILMMMVMEKVEVKKVKADCDSLQQIFTESKMDTSKLQTSYKLIFNCELSMIYMKVGTIVHHIHLQKIYKRTRILPILPGVYSGWLTTILLSFNYKRTKSSSMIQCSPRWPSTESQSNSHVHLQLS